jgi:hypothetical protein
VVNYSVIITEDYTTNDYYLSPFWNYSDNHVDNDFTGFARFSIGSIAECLAKLESDMERIESMNFNTVRIVGISPKYESGNLSFPTGSLTTYFALLEQLLDLLAVQDLKAILSISAPKDETLENQYIDFLNDFTEHFNDNTTILGYDFFNEPRDLNIDTKEKYRIASRVSNWHYTVKNNAPNHLTTVGYTHAKTVFNYDPALHPVDFASFHIYAKDENSTNSNNIIAGHLKWFSDNINIPWIIGETGYSGTNNTVDSDPNGECGTESQQKQFADFTLQRALDCNCKGYSWWNYQEYHWDDEPIHYPWEDFLGIITRYDRELPNNGEREKLVGSSFRNFNTSNIDYSNCTKPSTYYNGKNYTYLQCLGKIVDNDGNPIQGAVIYGRKTINGSYPNFLTYTDENGDFRLYTQSGGTFDALWISYPGYSITKLENPRRSIGTRTITANNYMNCWLKKWSNENSNSIAGWTIRNNDKFYPGDFDGDGVDELLCVNQNTNGWLTLLDYYNDAWHWVWSTYGSSSAGTYLYNFRNNLTVGDFDGNGKDEIFGVSSYGMRVFKYEGGNFNQLWYKNSSTHGLWPYTDNLISGDYDGDGKDEILGNDIDGNGWITMFNFDNGNFNWGWSDGGSGNLRPYRDNLIAGDFDGDGKDEILGNDIDGNGWITMFNFDNGNFIWGWSDGGVDNGMRPYRNNFIVGNFDTDPADEILGIYTWATKFDFTDNKWLWSWSTENTQMLGDWEINVNNSFFFTKAKNDDPEYFMVLSTNTSSDFCNMYLKNPIEGTNTTNTFTVPFTVTGTTIGKSNDWDLKYTDGADASYKFSITSSNTIYATTASSKTTIQQSKIEVFDMDKKSIAYKYIGSPSSNNQLIATLGEGIYYIVVDGYDEGDFKLTVSTNTLKSASDGENEFDNPIIEDIENSVRVYPNPAQSNINIIFPEDNLYTLKLLNINGKTIKTTKCKGATHSVNCNDITSGVYILQVISEKKIYQQKVLITK